MTRDTRLEELTAWLRRIDDPEQGVPVPASGDASFRRYFRTDTDPARIAMDAPPAQEDCRPFVTVAAFLEDMGLNAPRVLEADLEAGFLLLTDLGTVPYLTVLDADPGAADGLYRDAIDALLRIQAEGARHQAELPPYDDALLRVELSLFSDWLCATHLGIEFDEGERQAWDDICDLLVANALRQRRVFVHRDYHSRNLMVTSADNPGILDFQDAVEGPVTYDLVSLLKDCYIKWPAATIRERALYFHRRLPESVRSDTDEAAFLRQFDLMGVQRHLKAAGIFARLLHRDGKTGYLKDVPRTLQYVLDLAPDYAELEFLAGLIGTRALPALRDAGE